MDQKFQNDISQRAAQFIRKLHRWLPGAVYGLEGRQVDRCPTVWNAPRLYAANDDRNALDEDLDIDQREKGFSACGPSIENCEGDECVAGVTAFVAGRICGFN
ncbi:hypothetical protein [Sphingomonas oryzagri]